MRRTVLLFTSMVLTLLLGSGVALLALSEQASATFPGQNGRIAFYSNMNPESDPTLNPEGDTEIFTMKQDGLLVEGEIEDYSDIKNLTHTKGKVRDSSPDYSPDGTMITYARLHRGNSDIYVMNSNGSNKTQLTTDPATVPAPPFDTDPAFAPDGNTIVFTTNRDGNWEIYKMDTDPATDDAINLTDNPADDQEPAVSPDGQIAFSSDREDPWDIYTMDADGSDQTRRTEHRGADLQPDYSPDGQQITFASDRDKDRENLDIYTMNSDGTDQKPLPEPPDEDHQGNNQGSPTFSPDGKWIAFSSLDEQDFELYKMKASNGEDLTPLTKNMPSSEEGADWQSR